jgi:hypothetical protein
LCVLHAFDANDKTASHEMAVELCLSPFVLCLSPFVLCVAFVSLSSANTNPFADQCRISRCPLAFMHACPTGLHVRLSRSPSCMLVPLAFVHSCPTRLHACLSHSPSCMLYPSLFHTGITLALIQAWHLMLAPSAAKEYVMNRYPPSFCFSSAPATLPTCNVANIFGITTTTT